MNDKLINFKLPSTEAEHVRKTGEDKGFMSLSSFIRFIVRKYYKQAPENKNKIFNG